MVKVTVTIELDEDAYRAKYGPGTEWWDKYRAKWEHGPDGNVVKTPKPASEYKPMEGKALNDAVLEVLNEGFYDWSSQGWMKLTVDGKAARQCCLSLEGEAHLPYCEKVNGAEASEA